ncbi:MAG: RcpC/CpaB family pilus assembly protein [Elusimicrobiota bacterium]|nr:RcpC/CpaB family pilus assembly protein [Elusimicrobiota bacterium]
MRRLLLVAALASCSPAGPGYAPPAGKRGVTVPVAPGQARYLQPGDTVELVVLTDGTRPDGAPDPRSESVAPDAEVLRVDAAWSKENALVQVALTPAQAQWVALALDLERKLLLHELARPRAALSRARAASPAALGPGRVGAAVVAHPDQVEFLSPGQRVDAVLTRAGAKGAKEELVARVAVQDALVLGRDQARSEEEWASVQLAVTPEEAKVLAEAAGAEDPLLLLLRAPGDAATAPVEPVRSDARLGRSGEPQSPRL